jgi:hypothetical protein
MDTVGDHYQYFGEILSSTNFGRIMDIYDIYGDIYPTHISGVMVSTKKGKRASKEQTLERSF